MKIQIDFKNNNTQIANDDTTTQIQIGFSKWWLIGLGIVVLIVGALLWA